MAFCHAVCKSDKLSVDSYSQTFSHNSTLGISGKFEFPLKQKIKFVLALCFSLHFADVHELYTFEFHIGSFSRCVPLEFILKGHIE